MVGVESVATVHPRPPLGPPQSSRIKAKPACPEHRERQRERERERKRERERVKLFVDTFCPIILCADLGFGIFAHNLSTKIRAAKLGQVCEHLK